MSKRHKHVKKSSKKTDKSNPLKKGLPKAAPKRGSGNAQKARSGRHKTKPKVKPVSKGSKIHSRGTPRKLRGNLHSKTTTKNRGNNPVHKKGAKKAGQVKGGLRRKYIERLRRSKELEREIQRLQEERENLDIESAKIEAEFTNRKKPIGFKRWIQTKEGERLKEKKTTGYRYIYQIRFPGGDFEKKINYIRHLDFGFLNNAINRRRVAPRAVSIVLESRTKGGRSRYFRTMSDIDFVVNLLNIKKLTLSSMIEWQDRFMIGVMDRGDDYLEGSGKEFNPDNLYAVSYQFIY